MLVYWKIKKPCQQKIVTNCISFKPTNLCQIQNLWSIKPTSLRNLKVLRISLDEPNNLGWWFWILFYLSFHVKSLTLKYLFMVIVDYNKKLDYKRGEKEWEKIKRSSSSDWDQNVEALVRWSPFSSEADLLRQVTFHFSLTLWFI